MPYSINSLMEESKGAFIIVDYVILIFALVINIFSLNAIVKTQFGLTSYRTFLISLAVSDLFLCCLLLVNLVSQAFADVIFQSDYQHTCVVNVLRSLILFGFFANLYNLIGMSFDHFLGIVYPLRYRYMVNKAIAWSAIAAIWFFALISGFADIPFLAVAFYNRPKLSPIREMQNRLLTVSNNLNCSNKTIATSNQATDRPLSSIFLRSGGGNDVNGDDQDILDDPPHAVASDWEAFNYNELARLVKNKLNPLNSSLLFPERGPCEEMSLGEQKFFEAWEDYNEPEKVDNFCSYANLNKYGLELFVVCWTLISFVILALCYGRIFKMVVIQRKNRSIRKLIITTCLLLGIFAICWLPLMLFEIIMLAIVSQSNDHQITSPSLLVAHNVFSTMFLLHPLLNPIIYVARLPNVQRSILMRYSACLPCCRKYAERLSTAQQLVLSMTHSLRRISRTQATRINSAISVANNNNNGTSASSFMTIDAFDQAILNYGNHSVAQFISTNNNGINNNNGNQRNHNKATATGNNGDITTASGSLKTTSRQESLAGKTSQPANGEDDDAGLELLPIIQDNNNNNQQAEINQQQEQDISSIVTISAVGMLPRTNNNIDGESKQL